MQNSIRRERFLRVSQNRLERALTALDAIEKLANKSNYDYTLQEVNSMSGQLMVKVKLVMSSFGSGSAAQRFQRLVEQDRLQYRLLRDSDPEVYELVSSVVDKNNPIKDAYDSIQTSLEKNDQETVTSTTVDEILSKFKILFDDLITRNNKELSEASRDDDFYILDPEFDMSRLTAPHNIKRLEWLRRGRCFKEILSATSPYRDHPDPKKREPIANLRWDIKEGRVIQATNNKVII